MGNTSSAKNRHPSGDDAAPTLTAKHMDSNIMLIEDNDTNYVPPAQGRRSRASTITPGQEPTIMMVGRALPTVFKWEGGGKEVAISGSFNGWKGKIPLVKSNNDFYTIVDLPVGDHQYKYLVDGQWVHNPGEPTTSNSMGTLNNVIKVKKSDFEVFEALAIDSRNTNASKRHQDTPSSGSPPGEYGQEIPSKPAGTKHSAPPFLPPQLLQVILNKDTPAHCEPSLLPEPNHVMLNHLYALSIKDGVMVLSATHRFRKKYVTTLLYKPI
ncbi:5'-AMP-activated protein kinase subunit beta-2-like [Gigantopelta aegis]|uniref:5'-AMP-activated protein kinase subunit beta-2-like n=1 Tax=Gigantopelta aegis TaxID=1735272 RepID=UPI001B88C699|nr:5'-AMP-activated protein kinase subunit beta-2-like [Gigantopelta aegis]